MPTNADLIIPSDEVVERAFLDGKELAAAEGGPWSSSQRWVFDLGELSARTTYGVRLVRDSQAIGGGDYVVSEFTFTTGEAAYEAPSEERSVAVLEESGESRRAELNANCMRLADSRECYDTGTPLGLGYREYVTDVEAIMWVAESSAGWIRKWPGWDCEYPLEYRPPPATSEQRTLYGVRPDGSVVTLDVVFREATNEAAEGYTPVMTAEEAVGTNDAGATGEPSVTEATEEPGSASATCSLAPARPVSAWALLGAACTLLGLVLRRAVVQWR